MNFKPIETKRLLLRQVTEQDVQDFFELDANPRVHRYLGNNPVKTLAASEAMIVSILEQYETNQLGRLAIIEKTTGKFIGWAGLKYVEMLRKEFNYYDIGYRLKEEFWGKGYATEAAVASLNYGFKDLNLKQICGAADINNDASNAILKKIGMQHKGTFTYDGELCNWYEIKNPFKIPL